MKKISSVVKVTRLNSAVNPKHREIEPKFRALRKLWALLIWLDLEQVFHSHTLIMLYHHRGNKVINAQL